LVSAEREDDLGTLELLPLVRAALDGRLELATRPEGDLQQVGGRPRAGVVHGGDDAADHELRKLLGLGLSHSARTLQPRKWDGRSRPRALAAGRLPSVPGRSSKDIGENRYMHERDRAAAPRTGLVASCPAHACRSRWAPLLRLPRRDGLLRGRIPERLL